ncbi:MULTISPECIES: helix-turn-helix domain-containing protein [unclassified Paenibacillus]|uniref:PucR family transcriptional regulator n=1 Tax=unclassified Paenibacillus TaxID=185978 RepID=UPI0037CA0303
MPSIRCSPYHRKGISDRGVSGSHGSVLLKTLFYYLENRGSLIDTANYFFIHHNSVKYRLERIRDMMDFDLNDSREQFICHTCLIHYYLREYK